MVKKVSTTQQMVWNDHQSAEAKPGTLAPTSLPPPSYFDATLILRHEDMLPERRDELVRLELLSAIADLSRWREHLDDDGIRDRLAEDLVPTSGSSSRKSSSATYGRLDPTVIEPSVTLARDSGMGGRPLSPCSRWRS